MLAKRIIPCLDVKNGQTVKGTNFLNLRHAGDPVELGRTYSEQGADELVFLDITASHEGRKTFADMVERVAAEISIPFTVGGGISELRDVEAMLNAGADKVSINSAAIRNPGLIDELSTHFGNQFVVVAIDAACVDGRWMATTHGGTRPSDKELFSWAREAQERGAGEILFTSMDHDGTRNGYPCDTMRALSSALQIPIIASGGAGSIAHIAEVLSDGCADAALAASIFHSGEIPIPVLKKALIEQGINVRPI